MKKILLVTTIVWSVLTLATFTTYNNIVTKPAPSSLQALHLDACQLPCWVGITPGKTTLDEARELFKSAFSPIGSAVINTNLVPPDSRQITQMLSEAQSVIVWGTHKQSDLNQYTITLP